jgi:intracellular sulfur oxidation DsrE/DsrF family protein
MRKWWKPDTAVDSGRRRLMGGLALVGGLFTAATGTVRAAGEKADEKTLRFPGDLPEHFVVYQLNKADSEYHDHIVFSVGAMLRQYGDNIKVAVVAFGPGIHVLLKKPRRVVSQEVHEKIISLHEYGVDFFACGNTLKSLKLDEADVLPLATVVEVGASKLMELQKQGYAYISW